jgi:hypothetical protein
MSYKLRCVGMNFIKKDEEYIFTPFTTKNVIYLQMDKNGILDFCLGHNSFVLSTTIYRKNKKKIKIFENEKRIVLSFIQGEIIKLVPQVKNINDGFKIILKNISVKENIGEIPDSNITDNILNENIKNNATLDIINNIKDKIIIAQTNDNEGNATVKNNIHKNNTVNIKKIKFIIVTAQWGIKIAESLKNMLEELDYKAVIIKDKINDDILEKNKKKPNEYFIILFSHLVPKLPEPNKYIVYQLEQKTQSKLVTDKVLNNISNSLITWDYSNGNITQFDTIYKNKIVFQPISIITKIYKNDLPIVYDILFYGAGCMRRNKILKYLKKQKYNIFITDKIFGDEMYKIISQSKIILNLHVYEDSILEIARINETLPFNKIIISELPCEADFVNKIFYQDKIIFSNVVKRNLSNITNLTDLIDYYLKSENYNKFTVNNGDNINKIYSHSIDCLKNNLNHIKSLVETNHIINNVVDENTFIIEKESIVQEKKQEVIEQKIEQLTATKKYKLYESSSQVLNYFKTTDTIWGKNSDHIVNHVLKKSNHFDVDTFFYSKINNLKKKGEVSIFKDIKDNGIEEGLIYHPKQLKNIFPDIDICITDKRKLYIKYNDDYVKAHKFVNNELYNKDFDWYMSQITMMYNYLINNSLLIVVFIGDENVGVLLLDKINDYKKKQSFTIGVCFRNKILYEKMKDFIINNFYYCAIFISKEYGNDIVPTMQMYYKISSLIKFDKIIKLHTKSSDLLWFNELSDFLLKNTISELSNMKNIKSNCVGPKRYYAKDTNPNINVKILDKYKDFTEDKYFIRGSMFYCDKNVFNKMIELIKIDYKLYFNNCLYDTNNINFTNSPVHVLERLFGIMKI